LISVVVILDTLISIRAISAYLFYFFHLRFYFVLFCFNLNELVVADKTTPADQRTSMFQTSSADSAVRLIDEDIGEIWNSLPSKTMFMVIIACEGEAERR
jgi:hypothetical protein